MSEQLPGSPSPDEAPDPDQAVPEQAVPEQAVPEQDEAPDTETDAAPRSRRRPEGAARTEWGLAVANDDDNWERLSAKKLLLDPLSAVKSMAIPILAVGIGASTSGADLWIALAIGGGTLLFSLFAVIPWFTHRFRVTDQRLQFRTGFFSTTMLSAPLDRIRSIDLEANLIHRLLGLRNVQIGTGVDDDRIELDGIDVARAEELRRYLLDRRAQHARRAAARATPADAGAPEQSASPWDAPDAATPLASTPFTSEVAPLGTAPEKELAVFNWKWLRFAPFDLTRLAVIAAAIGFFFQVIGEDLVPDSAYDAMDEQTARIAEISLVIVIAVGLVLAVAGWILIAVIGYIIQWWGLRLTSSDGSLHMTHGLLTTRSISVEEKRVRGVEISEPLLLRPVKGAELSTLATGVGSGGTTAILPQAPTAVVRRVGEEVAEADDILHRPLVRHSRAARRRAHIRQQWGTLFVLGAGWGGHTALLHFTDATAPLWWFLVPGAVFVPLAVVFAELAYAHLGHALTDRHLVVGSGTTTRTRTALELDGIIGWVITRSFFQRRLGLCTLTATTAAGGESVELLDVDEDVAVALMRRATPDPVAPFLG